jgi:hypothetical protein
MHCIHWVQVNILRLILRGFKRMGQACSQELSQSTHSDTRERLKPTTIACLLPIQTKL